MRTAAIVAAIGAFATTVLADGASIAYAINVIDNGTVGLNNSINQWDGSFLGSLSILSASGTLISDINNGTKTAQASAELDTNGAVEVYTAVTKLQGDVNTTITNLIANKPKFQKLLLDGIIEADLTITKNDSDQFSAAVLAKVPSDYQSIAQGVVASIDASFAQALAAFSN